MQSSISPAISTWLYCVVFGAAIGPRIPEVGGVSYGAFIVPGLIGFIIGIWADGFAMLQVVPLPIVTPLSLGMTLRFLAAAPAVVAWIFKTGYRLETWGLERLRHAPVAA